MTTTASPPGSASRGVGAVRPARALLRDGTPAVLVALGPEDAPGLLDLHQRLPDRDRYLRFATLHSSDLEGYVLRTVDPRTGAVSLGARVRGRLVGAAQLLPLGGDVAEVAVLVDAGARHAGVATVLLEELAVTAGRLGISRFVALVLAENGPMIRVQHDLGLPLHVRREGTALRIEVALHPDGRYLGAAEERHRTAAAASLQAALRPRSVAVVGAGRAETSFGRAVLRGLHAAGFPGEVFAVNPNAVFIEGIACRPSVRGLPGPVDLAVVCVSAPAVADVVEQCGDRGCGRCWCWPAGSTASRGRPTASVR